MAQSNKLAEIITAPHPSTPESSGKVELKLIEEPVAVLDRALFIGGKCQPSNGSGKSPGLNQFAFGIELRLSCGLLGARTLGDPFPILCRPQSHSITSNVARR
jgi:hypothetical protein